MGQRARCPDPENLKGLELNWAPLTRAWRAPNHDA